MERNSPLYQDKYFKVQRREISDRQLSEYMKFFEEDGFLTPIDRVLEIGCANGSTLSKISPIYQYLTGVDINNFAMAKAENKPNFSFVTANSNQLPFKDASFDSVVSIHTLEHIPDLKQTMQEINRVLVQGGTSMHVFPLFKRHLSALPDAIRMHPLNPMRAWQTAGQLHVHNITRKLMDEATENTDLHHYKSTDFYLPFLPLPFNKGIIQVKLSTSAT